MKARGQAADRRARRPAHRAAEHRVPLRRQHGVLAGPRANYTKAVEEWFRPHKDHEVVKQAKRLCATTRVSFDAVASFAVHLDGIDPPKLTVPCSSALHARAARAADT